MKYWEGHMIRSLEAIVSVIFFLGLSNSLFASELEDATGAYDRGDYTTALQLLLPLAGHGNSRAEFYLGRMYVTGQVFRRTTRKPSSGISSRLQKAMRIHKSLLVLCMKLGASVFEEPERLNLVAESQKNALCFPYDAVSRSAIPLCGSPREGAFAGASAGKGPHEFFLPQRARKPLMFLESH